MKCIYQESNIELCHNTDQEETLYVSHVAYFDEVTAVLVIESTLQAKPHFGRQWSSGDPRYEAQMTQHILPHVKAAGRAVRLTIEYVLQMEKKARAEYEARHPRSEVVSQ